MATIGMERQGPSVRRHFDGARGQERKQALIVIPGLVIISVSFLVPLVWLARTSFAAGVGASLDRGVWTVANYAGMLANPYTWSIAWNTLKLGLMVTIVTVVITYPLAYFLHRTTSRWRSLLVLLTLTPLLTSQVVRTYGWIVILGRQGVINSTLMKLGLISQPLELANNYTGVVIALAEILMPYCVLVMLSGFGQAREEFIHAATTLGANRTRAFMRVTLPLTMPGVLTSALLVFVLTISSFVTPRLLGGGRVLVLSTEVYDQSLLTLNWALAATLAMFLLVIFGFIVSIYLRIVRNLTSGAA